jgi:hypothetical protein
MQVDSEKIIDALGGTGQVSKLFSVTAQAVSQWRKDGIPPARLMYLKLYRPDLFEQKEAA